MKRNAGILALIVCALAVVASAAGGYHWLKTTPVAGDQSWDYCTVDSPGRRLYVSHSTHVVVINPDTGEVVGKIENTDGVHGIAIAEDLGRGFSSNGKASFVPRVGFAWSPFQKTVVRGGAGIFYEQILPAEYITVGDHVPPYYEVSEIYSQNIPIQFPNAFFTQTSALSSNLVTPQVDGFPFNFKQPTIYKWGLDIEQQVGASTSVQVGYSGTRGVHLVRGNLDLDSQPTTTINGATFILLTQPLLNPNFAAMQWRLMDGESMYNALRVGLTKRAIWESNCMLCPPSTCDTVSSPASYTTFRGVV